MNLPPGPIVTVLPVAPTFKAPFVTSLRGAAVTSPRPEVTPDGLTEHATEGLPQHVSAFERIAWYSLLAVPVAVPIAVSKLPFAGQPPITYNMFVYAKLLALCWTVGVSLLAWLAGVLAGGIATRTVPLRWWLAAFFGLATVSTLVGLSPMRAFFGGQAWADGLLVLLLGGAIYVLVTQLVTTARRLRAFTWATVVGGVIVAAVGMLQVLGVNPLGPYQGLSEMTARGASLLGNPNFTGTYLVVPAVLALALTMSEEDRRRRVAALSAFVLTTTALVATLTRGAWLGMAAGLIVLGVALLRSDDKSVRPLRVALSVAAALAVPLLLILRDPTLALRQITNLMGEGTAGSGRVILWREALAVIGRHPLFGTGPDSYLLGLYGARTVASVRLAGSVATYNDPHNVLLFLAATLGIPAAVAAVGLISSSLYSSASAAFTGRSAGGRLAYSGWWAALVALCASLFFSTNTTPVVVAVFSAMGVLVVPRTKASAWPVWVRHTLCTCLAALAVAALIISTLTIAADRALMLAQTSPDRIVLSEQAARLAPWYTTAAQQAAWGYADTVQERITAGDPRANADAAMAEERLRELIAAEPREYQNYVKLAAFLEGTAPVLGQDALRRAAEAASAGRRVYPASPDAARLEARAQIGLGDASGAARTLEPLWEIDPHPSSGVAYVEALLGAGERSKAQIVADVLEKRFPGDPSVQKVADETR